MWGNPIRDRFATSWDSLRPVFVDVPHVYHYGCHRSGKAGVATHFKVRVLAHDRRPEENVAKHCKFKGRQNGGIAIGARVDREYHCPYRIRADDGRVFAQGVAVKVTRRDLLKQVRQINGKICVLRSSDAQCASCKTTDKLIARMKIVAKDDRCPANTHFELK